VPKRGKKGRHKRGANTSPSKTTQSPLEGQLQINENGITIQEKKNQRGKLETNPSKSTVNNRNRIRQKTAGGTKSKKEKNGPRIPKKSNHPGKRL